MTSTEDANSRKIAQWKDDLDRGTQFDNWGQMIEACAEYDKAVKGIKETISTFPENQIEFLQSCAIAILLRSKAAQDLSGNVPTISLKQIKLVIEALSKLPADVPTFPLPQVSDFKHIFPLSVARQAQTSVSSVTDDPEHEDPLELKGGSLKPLKPFPNATNVSICIEKIQLEEAGQYLDPFVTVSVKDANGKDICDPQDTPPTNRKDDYVHFNQTVEIQQPFEKLPEDCAIFLEFKHYKAKKHKVSVKCFSILEMDELQTGGFPLEIYAKPTDFKRRKLHLLTQKKHYMWVNIRLTKN